MGVERKGGIDAAIIDARRGCAKVEDEARHDDCVQSAPLGVSNVTTTQTRQLRLDGTHMWI